MLQSIYDSGMADLIYRNYWILTIPTALGISLFLGWKYGVNAKKTIPVVVIVFLAESAITSLLFQIPLYMRGSGVSSVVRAFVYLPLIALLCAKLFKVPWRTVCDTIAPGICAAQGVGSSACIFTGCCHGYPLAYGIYNPVYEMKLFPVQLCETGTSLLIAFYLIILAKEKNYTSDGKSYPLMLMLFGTARFMWEFFRNNTKVLWGCSDVALHSLFMIFVGAAAYMYLKKKTTSERLVQKGSGYHEKQIVQ